MSLIRPNTEKYVTVSTAKGGKSQACGDPVSMALAGATLEEVRSVGEAFGITDWQKYEQRNPGQQRMMIGNRIRGVVAKMQRAKDAAIAKGKAENVGQTDKPAKSAKNGKPAKAA